MYDCIEAGEMTFDEFAHTVDEILFTNIGKSNEHLPPFTSVLILFCRCHRTICYVVCTHDGRK